MRALLVVVLLCSAAACTPFIPVKDDFGTSALARGVADTPPEYNEFNAINPSVNALLADQMCATPYQPLEERMIGSATGEIVMARGRCQTHTPLFGND